MAQLHAIVRFIVYLIFTFAIFIFSLLIVANDEYAKDGMVKISFHQPLRRGLPNLIQSGETIATKIESKGASIVTTAIAAGETLLGHYIPSGATVGTKYGCLEFSDKSRCLSYEAINIATSVSAVFIAISAILTIPAIYNNANTAWQGVLWLSLLSCIASTISFSIAQSISYLATELHHSLGGSITYGIGYIAIACNFGPYYLLANSLAGVDGELGCRRARMLRPGRRTSVNRTTKDS